MINSFQHCISIVSDFVAHQKSAVKTISVIPEGPQVLTGSLDNSIKVWNFSQGVPELVTTIPTGGAVQHIEVKDGKTVVLSCDESLTGDPKNNVPVGIVKVLNPNDNSLISVKVIICIIYYILCYFKNINQLINMYVYICIDSVLKIYLILILSR